MFKREQYPDDVLVLRPSWRDRLRAACNRSPLKRSAIAREAGSTEETLSRILTGHSVNPGFELVVRLTHAAGEHVGWILSEDGFTYSGWERAKLLEAADIIKRHDPWGISEEDMRRLYAFIGRQPE